MQRAEQDARNILEDTVSQGRKGVRLADWKVEQTRDVRAPLFVLLGAVGLLLVIACVNVATLTLGEAATREHEIAARVALGAGRRRLIQQLLTESLTLAIAGCALGTLLAWWGTKAVVTLAPPRIPGIGDVHMDGRVLMIAIAAAIVTGITFGLAPALTLSRLSGASLVRAGSGLAAAGRGRLQRIFIAIQVAFSLLLLVGATLMGRSLLRLTAVDPGFRADSVLAVRFGVPVAIARDSVRLQDTYARAIERLTALPGVTGLSATSNVPFDGGSSSSSVEIEGHPIPSGGQRTETQQRYVKSGFFAFLGIPILAGRGFDDNDRAGSELVAVVSESMARRDWPNESPIGRRVKFQKQWRTVIGVARDIRFRRLSVEGEPTIYVPLSQASRMEGTLLLRTAVPPTSLTNSVRSTVLALDPGISIGTIETMDAILRRSLGEERFRTTLLSTFGALAALLAAVGMYGIASRAVARRTREVGIRVALGATGGNVVRLIVRSSLDGVGIGVAAGLVLALSAAHWVGPLLYAIDARDPSTYAAIVTFLAVISIVATWLPARRASRVHPAMVLRGD